MPHFSRNKNENLVGTPLKSFTAVAWAQKNGVVIKTSQGTFASSLVFTLTAQWKKKHINEVNNRKATYANLLKVPGGTEQARQMLVQHAKLQAFNEEQDLHYNNAEVSMGSKLPAHRFDQSALSRQDRKAFGIVEVNLGYREAPPAKALHVFVEGAYQAFTGYYPA